MLIRINLLPGPSHRRAVASFARYDEIVILAVLLVAAWLAYGIRFASLELLLYLALRALVSGPTMRRLFSQQASRKLYLLSDSGRAIPVSAVPTIEGKERPRESLAPLDTTVRLMARMRAAVGAWRRRR